jgi:zinc transporter, ZIP family
LYSSIAAAAAVLGVVPLIGRDTVPSAWIGWSNALAAGVMLGAAYLLLARRLDAYPVAIGGGALLGVAFSYWTHRVARTEDLDLARTGETDPVYGYKILLVNSIHSAVEGVAIGIAMVMSLRFGILVALAIALHNIPESTVLGAVLRGRGVRVVDAAGLAVGTNVGQVLMAIVTYSVVTAAPDMAPVTAGVAVGALVHLVLAESLPESYHQAGPTSIALVTSLAIGAVVLAIGAPP